ncbi:DUF3172 domain-containing protein [Leptolyngbya sp. AN02str]|uniref:DUF3172 domain-containing protein n=1 Tax=Leptolyngbya sp. AN02str TaxID=3423363 RepID=UPI003D31B838
MPPRNVSQRPPVEPQNRNPVAAAFNYTTAAIMAAVFILGIGLGIAFSSTANFGPENIASREVIDRSAPNAEMCAQYGASSITMDLRAFVTLNPFNVYVSQPAMQPGCVLRSTNWSILERQNLVSSDDVRQCRQRLNTFGFTGNLDRPNEKPKIDCVYQNDAAKNLFLNQPGFGENALPRETERF